MAPLKVHPGTRELARKLGSARRVLAITGAGISTDSGLPVYRGTGGLYDRGQAEDGHSIEEILSSGVFRSKPALTWKYVRQLGCLAESAQFNRGHQVLQEMERFFPEFLLVTQNIDGLHVQAGSRSLSELHGNLSRTRCDACGNRQRVTSYRELENLPLCITCARPLRPDVVLFDEYLPQRELGMLQEFLADPPEICLMIGTSCQFAYLASAVVETFRAGGLVAEINPRETQISELASIQLRQGAAEALDEVWNECLGLSEEDRLEMREA